MKMDGITLSWLLLLSSLVVPCFMSVLPYIQMIIVSLTVIFIGSHYSVPSPNKAKVSLSLSYLSHLLSLSLYPIPLQPIRELKEP